MVPAPQDTLPVQMDLLAAGIDKARPGLDSMLRQLNYRGFAEIGGQTVQRSAEPLRRLGRITGQHIQASLIDYMQTQVASAQVGREGSMNASGVYAGVLLAQHILGMNIIGEGFQDAAEAIPAFKETERRYLSGLQPDLDLCLAMVPPQISSRMEGISSFLAAQLMRAYHPDNLIPGLLPSLADALLELVWDANSHRFFQEQAQKRYQWADTHYKEKASATDARKVTLTSLEAQLALYKQTYAGMLGHLSDIQPFGKPLQIHDPGCEASFSGLLGYATRAGRRARELFAGLGARDEQLSLQRHVYEQRIPVRPDTLGNLPAYMGDPADPLFRQQLSDELSGRLAPAVQAAYEDLLTLQELTGKMAGSLQEVIALNRRIGPAADGFAQSYARAQHYGARARDFETSYSINLARAYNTLDAASTTLEALQAAMDATIRPYLGDGL